MTRTLVSWALRLAALLACAALILSGWSNRKAHDASEIALLSDRLFEFGAIDYVHGRYDGANKALFDCVAQGKTLSEAQSKAYRRTYQAQLLHDQAHFVRLDKNLQLRRDQGMTLPNNAGGHGIAGQHDHHDASASDNLQDIARALNGLQTAGFVARTFAANGIYKDLVDLMVHMAPAVHTVGLMTGDPLPDIAHTRLRESYQRFYRQMKKAQSVPLNSQDYWMAIEEGLAAYGDMVALIETEVWQWNGPLSHAISGRWLSLQTIAPPLSEDSPSAQARRGKSSPTCDVALAQ